ncbi:MAG: hypothetical protein E6K81_03405, partial [Candidatus Eisenbacteria bacterium]
MTNAGFRDFRFGGSLSTPTGEKPESKLWWNDGSWWGSLWDPNASSYAIHRLDLDTQSWVSTGTLVDTRSSSRADALWDGDHLYIVSHIFTTNAGSTGSGNSGRLYRYAYHAGTRSYSLDPGFPVNVNASKSEALVLAKDSSGRLWVTWVEGGKVKVNRTLGDDLSWGQPFDLPGQGADVTTDDISGIAAFGTDRVGLMWSNQADHKMYFAAHLDGGADMQWEPREDALADATLGQMADDHINLKMSCDGSGAVYAVTKTGLTHATDPLVLVLRRQAGGAWSRHVFGTVAENHTRPILCIDRDAGTAYVFAMSDRTGRRVIYEKRASLADLGFPSGLGTPFIDSPDDPAVSNPTSTKQCVGRASGLVVLASDQDTQYYLHNYLSLVPPPSIASFVPTDGPVGGEVTLTGTGFSGATAVEFNGTPAASYIVDSDAQIRATVPPGATTGRIVVTTPAGSGLSGSDFTVILSPTTTVLQSSANPSTWGAQVVLEATVAPAAATGTVRFFDGVTPLGTAPVSGGLATLSVNTLAVGQHELTASYDGGAWYAGSSSAPWSQAVDFASTTAVLDAQPAETHCA